MKTFRIIVFPVLAAIAIGGVVVDAVYFCKDSSDCLDDCVMSGTFLTTPFGDKGGAYGVCEELLVVLEGGDVGRYAEFVVTFTKFLNTPAAEQEAKLEETKSAIAQITEKIQAETGSKGSRLKAHD
eukprot:GHVS01062179.1.p1 GENE.GHVS01062179.1~~GHVS01062179.1.p1  ORF type:complete len:126 (+),score=15.32 GHVS01062179.1:160-537(+)